VRVVQTSTYLCAPVRYQLAYNRSRPDPLLGTPANDLMEVAVQKYRENPDIPFAQLVRLIYLADTGATWLGGSSIPQAVVHAVLTELDRWFQRANTWVDTDLRDIVADIRPHIERRERVLLVPHSQGNLFANMVMRALADAAPEASSLRQLGVASPAAEALRGTYLSSTNDTVLGKLRLLSPVLAANLEIPDNELARSLDSRGHNLIDIYLNPDLPGLAAIRTAMTESVQAMADPASRYAQCSDKAVGSAYSFEKGGDGCRPFYPATASSNQSGMIGRGLTDHGSLGWKAGEFDRSPARHLAYLNGEGTDRKFTGVWRIVNYASAHKERLYTKDGAVCLDEWRHQDFWAFVFDAR
jgi:hypothetical protein